MSNEGSGDEPEWIDLDAPDPAPRLASQGTRRRGWLLSVVAIAAVAAVLAAVALWPDRDEPDEEVASGDLTGEPALFAVTSSGDLVEVDPATGEQARLIAEQVADDPTNVAISVAPDGSTAYVGLRVAPTLDEEQAPPEVVSVDLESGSVTATTVGRQPAVSPDGLTLAVVAPSAPPPLSPSVLLYGIGPSREPVELVLTAATPNRAVAIDDVAWSPDGAQLFVGFSGDQLYGYEIFDVAEEQGAGAFLSEDPGWYRPAAYLDVGVVASVDTWGDDPGVVVANSYSVGPPTTSVPDSVVDTTFATVMPGPTTTSAPDEFATGEPAELFRVDGTVIDLAAPIGERRLAAVVEPSDGGVPRLVVWSEDGGVVDVADGVTATAWGPPSAPDPDPDSTTTSAPPSPPTDGDPAIVAITMDGDLVELDPDTGDQRRVITESAVSMRGRDDGYALYAPGLAVTPDGRTAYVEFDGSGSPRVGGDVDIQEIDLATGVRESVASGQLPAVSPDGRELAYVKATTNDCFACIEIRDLETGAERSISLPEEISSEDVSGRLAGTPTFMQWRPNGRELYVHLPTDNEIGALVTTDGTDVVRPLWNGFGFGTPYPAWVRDDGVTVFIAEPPSAQAIAYPADGVSLTDQEVKDTLQFDQSAELFHADEFIVAAFGTPDGRLLAVLDPDDDSLPYRLVWWSGEGPSREVRTEIAAAVWVSSIARPSPDGPSTTTPPSNLPTTTIPGTRPTNPPEPPPPAAPATSTAP